ncbi:MAG: energy transducer TonB [Verrucomicrobiota bacterium JB022]|nr:energy transducer TonB [Verrucomicrobiota bacterium JB022]
MTRNIISLGLLALLATAASTQAAETASKVESPRKIVGEQPAYPIEARLQGIEGTVMVEFLVDEQGKPFGPGVVNDAHPLLAAEALKTIRNWQFEPATRDGSATYAVVRIPVVFSLTAPDHTVTPTDSLLAAK